MFLYELFVARTTKLPSRSKLILIAILPDSKWRSVVADLHCKCNRMVSYILELLMERKAYPSECEPAQAVTMALAKLMSTLYWT